MESLHRNVQLIWIIQTGILALGIGIIGYLINLYVYHVGSLMIGGLALVIFVLGVVHSIYRYRSWEFDIQDDALFLHHGVLTLVDTSVPYVRVQHVDTQRGPLSRLVGLSNVVVYTAGSRGADVTIPGLRPERATELREYLRDLAIESEQGDAV
ncbi:MAG: PH domain-containing protein [Halobacteriaceae archaeon]